MPEHYVISSVSLPASPSLSSFHFLPLQAPLPCYSHWSCPLSLSFLMYTHIRFLIAWVLLFAWVSVMKMSFFAPEVRSTNGRKGANANGLVVPLLERDLLASFLSGAELPCRSKEPPICRKQRDPSPHLDRRPIFSKVQNFYTSTALNTTTTSTKKPTNKNPQT